jgi:oligosaccharide repeat unit polymerase
MPYYLARLVPEPDHLLAQILILVSNIAFYLGSNFKFRPENTKKISIHRFNSRSGATRLLFLIFSYYLLLLPLLEIRGGLDSVINETRIQAAAATNTGSYYFIVDAFLKISPLVLALIALNYWLISRNRTLLLVIVLCIPVLLLFSNPVIAPRSVTLLYILPFISLAVQQGKLSSRFALVFLYSVIIFATNIFDRFTGRFEIKSTGIFSKSGDFDAYYQLLNGLALQELNFFAPLKQFSGSLLFFIPRSVWAGKPRDTGTVIAEYFGQRFQNLSAPLNLEMYINFGFFGLIIFFALLGFWISRIEKLSLYSVQHAISVQMFSGLFFIVLRGSLLQITGMLVFSIVLFLFIMKLISIREIVELESTQI